MKRWRACGPSGRRISGVPMVDLASGPLGATRNDCGRTYEGLTLRESSVLAEASRYGANLIQAAGLGAGRAVV